MPESGLLGYPGLGPAVDLDPNTQLFTASGIWTKPADCQWVRVILVGGGGGGGGGRRSNNITADRPGGGVGGGGGGLSFLDVPAGLLPSTVTVTIGAGGTGGAGATTANSSGSAGGTGGTSTFGEFLSATGGTSAANDGRPQGGSGHIHGGFGGQLSFGTPVDTWVLRGINGGGSGGSASGDQHEIIYPWSGYSQHSLFSEPQKYGVLGNPGGGGFPQIHASGVVGGFSKNGTAGSFGSGGGGGGGGRDTFDGGNGAAGGDGYCLVVSYGTKYRPVDVQEFTTSGAWRKPTDPRLTTARVFVIGGGGGGGSGRRWNRTNGAYLTGSRLALSQVSGNYASAPDSAALSITGDIDIQAKVDFTSWNEGNRFVALGIAQSRFVVSKYTTTGNQRSYYLNVNSAGVLILGWSTAGSADLTASADEVLNLEAETVKWVRATLDVNNGASGRTAKFYTSDDGSTWTQLGTTQTVAGTTSIFNSTAELNIGGANAGTSNLMEGSVYRVIIRNGYDGGGSVVFDADFETATAGATSFTESSVNAATVTINKTNVGLFGGGGGGGGGVSYAEIPLSALSSQVDVTVGLGGAGGAGRTSDYLSGLRGSYGGNSSFGTLVVGQGGYCGFGGTSSAGGVAMGRRNVFSFSLLDTSYNSGTLTGGGSGGFGGSGNGSAPVVSDFRASYITSGGGGGGGISSAGATAVGGVATKPAGYGTIVSDTAAASNGVAVFSSTLGMFGSTGGGGGSSNGTVIGGNGARGSGGGGGAATTTGVTSGAGGNGGDGYVLVVCV